MSLVVLPSNKLLQVTKCTVEVGVDIESFSTETFLSH